MASSTTAGPALRAASSARYAFVTLVTSDAYLPGAIVLAHSLRQAHSLTGNPAGTLTAADIANLGPAGLARRAQGQRQRENGKRVDLLCFVTPATVSIKTIRILLRHFDRVVGVEPLSFSGLTAAHATLASASASRATTSEARKVAEGIVADTRRKLKLLGRPDLGGDAGAPLTKLHAWRLTGYEKVIYLDADMIALRPIAHLFSITAALAASPDIGWPDSFNTGLLVLTPDLDTFGALREFAVHYGSWDGADQGLLNDFFGGEIGSADVGPGGGWQRLAFRYNVTPNAGYTFSPAYHRYGADIMMAHFIGQQKPWVNVQPAPPSSSAKTTDFNSLLARWYAHLEHCYPKIAATLSAGQAQVIHSSRGVEVVERSGPALLHEAIWDFESTKDDAEMTSVKSQRGHRPLSFRGAGQVEDLKSMFRPDIVAASATAELEALSMSAVESGNAAEGIYLTLPLDGRTSLMPLINDSDEESPPSSATSSQTATPAGQNSEETRNDGTWSPPKMQWDPSKEPPPTQAHLADYQMRNSVDTYFENAWDLPTTSHPKGKQAFFEAKQAEASRQRTLSRLQREHFFDNLGSEQPDVSKVKAVFPWEGATKKTARSSRIFPDEEPASVMPQTQMHRASLQAGSGHAPERRLSDSGEDSYVREAIGGSQSGMLGGAGRSGLPATLVYKNAWDRVESIRRGAPTDSVSSVQKTNRGSQTPQVRFKQRSAQADGSSTRWYGNTVDPNIEGPADQSGDGDNESSSSSEEDVIDARGTTHRREGPGRGYQRKAESLHSSAGTSPRLSRHMHAQSMSTSPNSSRTYTPSGGAGAHASSSGFYPLDMTLGSGSASSQDTRDDFGRSRTTSQTSEQYLTASSSPSVRFSERGAVRSPTGAPDSEHLDLSYASMSDAFYDARDGSMLLQSSSPPSGRRMHRSYLRSPHGSHPGSEANSGTSSPSASATPTNLSPSQSRADLFQMARGISGAAGSGSRRMAVRRTQQ